jgi:hypothetical protein
VKADIHVIGKLHERNSLVHAVILAVENHGAANVTLSTIFVGYRERQLFRIGNPAMVKSPSRLTVRIQADSVDTGSGLKNGKLKSKDFFAVDDNPEITFVSKKIVKTSPNTYERSGFIGRSEGQLAIPFIELPGNGGGCLHVKLDPAFLRDHFDHRGLAAANTWEHQQE